MSVDVRTVRGHSEVIDNASCGLVDASGALIIGERVINGEMHGIRAVFAAGQWASVEYPKKVSVEEPKDEVRAAWQSAKKLATELEEVRLELILTEQNAANVHQVLDAIPECPLHGPCVPHALRWIEQAKEWGAERKCGKMDNGAPHVE